MPAQPWEAWLQVAPCKNLSTAGSKASARSCLISSTRPPWAKVTAVVDVTDEAFGEGVSTAWRTPRPTAGIFPTLRSMPLRM